jgi:mannose-1-phosphate guanylyltransferase / mannose-6-phosphate isomerase
VVSCWVLGEMIHAFGLAAGVMKVLPVIVAGGAGQRLWPTSTPARPKPFASLLADGVTLFQRTLARAQQISRHSKPLVVCNVAHRALVKEQSADVAIDLLIEPVRRDTAAAICAAALWSAETYGDQVIVVVMPADHWIDNFGGFSESIAQAVLAATYGLIATVGIAPDRPATEYGYLRFGEEHHSNAGFSDVAAFIEKPNQATAESLVLEPQNFWNAGLFVARAGTLIGAFRAHEPDMLSKCKAAIRLGTDGDDCILQEADFMDVQKTSFDYAIMEKCRSIAGIKAAFGWRDLGTWAALSAISSKDEKQNTVIGSVAQHNCTHCYLNSSDVQIVAENCSGLLAVSDQGFVLVMPLMLSAVLRDIESGDRITIAGGKRLRISPVWSGGTVDIINTGSQDIVVVQHGSA